MQKLVAIVLTFALGSALFACPGSEGKTKDKGRTKTTTTQTG
ncbi:MAG: hypothetical protein RML34_11340 [Leptospiraceae bacterium]|nr:hypothetical protein [Leptospiraceae bacterium]